MVSPYMDPLGTITCLLSPVFKVVENKVILSTEPDVPATSTKSPFLIGLKTISMTPAAKFCSELWSERPMARPAAPIRAISEVVFTPSLFKAAMLITSRSSA